MIPFSTNKKPSFGFSKIFWSPSQEVIDSPCSKSIKNRHNEIRARALLDKFIQIKLREEDKERNQTKK